MTTLTLPFILNDWTIQLTAIPEYPEFTKSFNEPLDYHILEMMTNSNHPKLTSEMKAEITSKLLPNIDMKTGILKSLPYQPYGLGRVYGTGDRSIIPMAKVVKHTVLKYMGWTDIDMVKGHMSIAYEMGKNVRIEFKNIKRYIDHFDEICEQTREFYQLDSNENYLEDDQIKWLFCLMMYGGGLSCWVDGLEEGDLKGGYKPKKLRNKTIYSPFALEYKTETKQIIDRIYNTNKPLVRKLRKEEEEIHETKGRVASYWFQIIENHILYTVYELLCGMKIIKPRVCGREYDGLCLPQTIPFDKSEVIVKVNSHIREQTGMSILMKFKEYKDYVLPEFIEQRLAFIPPVFATSVEVVIDDEDANADDEYVQWKTKFEKEWCKIKNNGTFIRRFELMGKTSLVFQTEKLLITAYKHECYFKTEKGKKKRVPFILEWLDDTKMRCYDAVQCVPPPLLCPSNVYNLWIPSPFETQPITKDDPDFHMEAVSAFATHVKTLCGNNMETYKYVCEWIAHSIQKPAEKVGVALNFISEQGVGKNIFTDVLVALYGGNSKKLETSQPERDVWGSFNDLMADAFLVVLSETDKRNSSGHDGKIKNVITDETLTINPKGKTPFTMNSYHRYIQLTNNTDPVQTSKGDRRNVIIRCSDQNKGDSDYFKRITELFKSPNALRSIYWCFKLMDISAFHIGHKIITEYHEEIIGHNENPLLLFMKWFVENHYGIVELSPVELLAKFTDWKTSNRFKFGENMNTLSLLKKLKLELRIPEECMEIHKTMYSNTRFFDTKRLAQFLGMDYLGQGSVDEKIGEK